MSALTDIAAVNRALRAAPFDLTGSRASAVNRRALWDALLHLVHEEIARRGRAALVARTSKEGPPQLFVEGAQGRLRGALRDPLGLARAMVTLDLGRVVFDGDGALASLSTVVITLLAGPFKPVPGVDGVLYACADRFVDRVEPNGLPVLPGVVWERAAPKAPVAASAPRPFDGSTSIPRLMTRARALNEGQDDVVGATALWCTCAEAQPPGPNRSRVIAIMRSVARARSEAGDITGAVHIWSAVYGLAADEDGRLRLVKTMMKVANLSTDLVGPWEAVDVPAAVAIWQGVWRLHRSPDDDARVLRTMMDVANRLVDLRHGQPVRVGPAITVWRGVLALEVGPEERARVLATMMDIARRLADQGGEGGGLDDANAVWAAVHGSEPSLDGQRSVIKHMMAAANRRSQAIGAPEQRDIPGALSIWRAISRISVDDEDREVVTLTRMSVARAMVDAGDLVAALRLWAGAFSEAHDERERLRVVKTVLGLAANSPVLASQTAALLRGHEALATLDPAFRDPLLAGLCYYARDFGAVLEVADGSSAPAVAALAADALRKLGRLVEARAQADAVLRAAEPDPIGLDLLDAKLSALCCRAYCHLEQSRVSVDLLDVSWHDLAAAEALAERAGLPLPPRVYTGRGYILRARGQEAEAEVAFAAALRLDGDNRKAREAGIGAEAEDASASGPDRGVPASLAAFETAVRAAMSAGEVATLLRAQVVQGITAGALEPYGRAVMARARRLHEEEGDLDGAVTLWSTCAEIQPELEDHRRVLAVMRAVARQRSEAGDVLAAVRVLQAVHRVAREPDQRLAVVKSMMHVANLHTALGGPWERVDVTAAIALWRGAWELHHSPDDDMRVIRTMMRVAAMLERLGPERAARCEAARRLQEAVRELETAGG